MNIAIIVRALAVAAVFACSASIASGYLVRPSRSLTALNTDADLVFKGTVTETKELTPAKPGPSFFEMEGSSKFAVSRAQFKIVSLIKGTPQSTVTFEYFDDPAPEPDRRGYEQVRYHFIPGRTYIVFAQYSGTSGLYRPLPGGPCFQTDEGVIHCANAKPVSAATIHGIVWDELTALLSGSDPSEKRYALTELAFMSGIGQSDFREGDFDFQRDAITALARPLAVDEDDAVRTAALAIINPHESTVPKPGISYECTPGETLSQTATKADFIFKGIAISSTSVGMPAKSVTEKVFFGSDDTFAENITGFKVVSAIKGSDPAAEITFRHYEDMTPVARRRNQPGLAYHFEPGRAYLVMARRTGEGTYAQLVPRFAQYKDDFGVLRCADSQPAPAKPLQEVMWRELVSLLRVGNTDDIEYAVRELDQLSGGLRSFDYRHGIDYQVEPVADLFVKLVHAPDPVVAQTAISLLSAHSPYMREGDTPAWLCRVGADGLPGLGVFPYATNPGGAKYWRDLAAVANSEADPVTRAYSISALGLVHKPALEANLTHWLADPDLHVRSSAIILLADYPALATRDRMTALASGSDVEILRATARSLGFGQRKDLADLLSRLLDAGDLKTRQYAAMSLTTLPTDDPTVAAVMKENLDNPEFGYVFVNALAAHDPQPYLDRLSKIAARKLDRSHWWGGRDPWSVAWRLLFGYVKIHIQDADTLAPYLDALETANKGNFRKDLLNLYQTAGLTERARNLEQRPESR